MTINEKNDIKMLAAGWSETGRRRGFCIPLNDEESGMLDRLVKTEFGLATRPDVVRYLIRKAAQELSS